MSFAPNKMPGGEKISDDEQQEAYYPEDEAGEDQEQLSQHDAIVADRINRLEDDVSKLTHTQDTYRSLFEMKSEVEKVKKIERQSRKMASSLEEHAAAIEELTSQNTEFQK